MQLKYFIKVIENLICGAKCISLNAGVTFLDSNILICKKMIPNSKVKNV